MTTISIDVPDELAAQLERVRDRLPELLALSLQQPLAPAALYRAILDFLVSNPSPTDLAMFAPPAEVQERLRLLLGRERNGQATPAEKDELDEYERIEHLIVMLKTANLPRLANPA
jgi:hypothetical protein